MTRVGGPPHRPGTALVTFVSVSMRDRLGLVVALVLHRAFRGAARARDCARAWAIPTVISARMWNWMLHDQFGVVNDALLRLGLISVPIAWTANAETALWAVVIVDVQRLPFHGASHPGSLQMLPSDIYEAARVDGIHPVGVSFA